MSSAWPSLADMRRAQAIALAHTSRINTSQSGKSACARPGAVQIDTAAFNTTSFQVPSAISSGGVRLQLNSLVESLESFGVARLLLERGPEARKIFRPGILANCARQPLNSLIKLPAAETQDSHKVQRGRLSGRHCKRLLTANLSLRVSPFAHVAKSGFIERVSFGGTLAT